MAHDSNAQMYNYFRPNSHHTIPRAKLEHTRKGHHESDRKKETSNAGMRKIANKWNLPWCSLSFIEANDLGGGYAIIQAYVVAINIIDLAHFIKKVKPDKDTIRPTFA